MDQPLLALGALSQTIVDAIIGHGMSEMLGADILHSKNAYRDSIAHVLHHIFSARVQKMLEVEYNVVEVAKKITSRTGRTNYIYRSRKVYV